MYSKGKSHHFLAGAFVTIIFGLSFLFTKEGLDVLEPFHLLGLRFMLAAIVFVLLRFYRIIEINLKPEHLKQLAFLTLMQPVLYFTCETLGVMMTSSSEAAIIIALVPVLVVALSAVYLGEKPTTLQIGFIFLSVGGVIFMTVMKGSIEIGGNLYGTFMLMGAAISAGVYNVLSRKISAECPPIEITYTIVLVGAAVFNAISLVQHINKGIVGNYFIPLLNLKPLLAIAYLGILSSLVAYFLLNYLLSQLDASRVAVISNVVPVISIAAGAILRNEPLYWFNIVGALMILCGVWGINYFGRDVALRNIQKSEEKSV